MPAAIQLIQRFPNEIARAIGITREGLYKVQG